MNSKKPIKSRYSLKQINSNYYDNINITSGTTNGQQLSSSSGNTGNPGYMWLPYIPFTMTNKEREELEKKLKQETRKNKLENIIE